MEIKNLKAFNVPSVVDSLDELGRPARNSLRILADKERILSACISASFAKLAIVVFLAGVFIIGMIGTRARCIPARLDYLNVLDAATKMWYFRQRERRKYLACPIRASSSRLAVYR